MKIKMGITKKLFIITTLVFVAFIVATFLVQSLFFEQFYVSQKKRDLKAHIESFKSDYVKAVGEEAVTQVFVDYEEGYNIKIIVQDEQGRTKFLQGPTRGRNDPFKFREADEFIGTWNAEESKRVKLFQGNVTEVQLIRRRGPGANNLMAISPIKEKNEVVFAVSSLQPVNEAVSVIERLYPYFFAGGILFTVLLSFIYSNMIAKPLVRINRAASKMAKLDFTEKCDVISEDEIGNVASSLNFLSENLDNALGSLREANAKLEEDIEKERSLERMRREFVAAVSHELKTPISLIGGYAGGLKDNIFEGEDKDYYLDVIMDEADKMGNLVSDMLDLSYLESGGFKLDKEDFDISELIDFTLKKYYNLVDEKGARVEKSLIENTMVNADWSRLEQVITNFVTNAIRHVEQGGIIYVNMVDKEESISIEVENTGSTIPEDELERIWGKFYKTDKSRNRQLGGTGIGLSIVKNILTLHGYEFGVENTERGVKFYFRIPR